MRIITNSNKENDRMKKLIQDQSVDTDILIASAFFSENDLIERMLDNNCNVSLIIRLGIGTDPDALEKIHNMKNIDIRFFTGTSFHPKFYIFGKRIAYLGSSNFTKSGLTTNQEVNIEIDSKQEIFSQLTQTFYAYWNSAEPLTDNYLNEFENIIKQCHQIDPFRDINSKIGNFEFNNVGREKEKIDSKKLFISNFRKNYQRFITKYRHLSAVYDGQNLRKFPYIPLLIEVDKFLWWIRDKKAQRDSYKNVPKKDNREIESNLIPLINEFYRYTDNYLENEVVQNYTNISKEFSNSEKIIGLNKTDLLDILLSNVNAFRAHARYEGGIEIVKDTFYEENSEKRVKETICYLLHGKGNYEERLFNCIHDDKYDLKMFGENCKKELFGLLNTDNIPIMNGGILKSLEWLGYGKL